jgi:transcriptional regulator
LIEASLLWYSRGELSRSKAAEIAGTSRADFIDELGRDATLSLAPLEHLPVCCASYLMTRKTNPNSRGDMLQGTLDILVLKTLISAPAHGHTIAHLIESRSEDILQVEHGSLYPALHRLEDRGWIASFWGTSENNRKAKYYRITPQGRKQLRAERSRWESLVQAVGRILGPAEE